LVVFKKNLDSLGKIYIPKILREAGLVGEIAIAANTRACVMFSSGTPLDQVIDSIEVIRQDLQNSLKITKTRGK
jgi:hypothetical protein